MRPLTRTTIGAALGSLLVVLIHPVSRPYALCGLMQVGPSKALQSSPLLAEGLDVLPQPKTVFEASIWMQEGAERLNKRQPLSNRDLRSLVSVANSAAREEPDNAFWPQMAAVFSSALDNDNEARSHWNAASKCTAWNDYQSNRFMAAKKDAETITRSEQSWQNAALFYRRSKDCAYAIHRFGRSQLSGATLIGQKDLELRMTALLNGVLLRDNSRSIDIGLYGVDLVESSCTQERAIGASPRKLIIARYGFIDHLRDHGMVSELNRANSAFLDNDAWLALLLKEGPAESMRDWSTQSVLIASAPGCLLLVAIIGYGFAGFGSLLIRRPKLTILVRSPFAPVFGIALSIAVYLTTGLQLFSLSIAACFAFLSIAPERERRNPPESFGPLFDFAIGTIALLFSSFVLAFFIGVTTPAVELGPLLGWPEEYYGGQTLPLGLATIVVSLLFLISPLWATAQRISTTRVVCIAIRNFGFDIGVLCSFLGIVLIPVAIYMDMNLAPNMSKALLNEPTFYLTR